jgi:ubiquinone biosynthesis protein Coq4
MVVIANSTRTAFEDMATSGNGDAGALAMGLRREVTSLGLRALAAKAVHAAAAAPERMVDIYDNAAAGWLAGPVFPPRLRTDDPLPISPDFWAAFWDLVTMPNGARRMVFAEKTLSLAGELDPRISPRLAAAVVEHHPGLAEAAALGIPGPHDLEAFAAFSPVSLGYALRQEMARAGGLVSPFGRSIVPFLRHMPPPLDNINIQVIQSMTLWGLVGGYSAAWLDEIALGGFLMAQLGHHYSALATAVTLTVVSLDRPRSQEVMLDSVFKGWAHGRETPLLLGVDWDGLWHLPVDKVRAELGVTAFASPFAAAMRQLQEGQSKH